MSKFLLPREIYVITEWGYALTGWHKEPKKLYSMRAKKREGKIVSYKTKHIKLHILIFKQRSGRRETVF